LTAWLRFYGAMLRIAVLGQIQYRASGMIWMIGSILEPVIFLVVWSTVARSQGGEVGGYGPHEFAAYYITLMLVNHLTFSWVMETFQYRVQSGDLSFQLLRPVHPIHGDIADNLAYKLVMMVVVTPAVVILVLVFQPHFEWVGWSLAVFVPALFLGFATRFLFEWSLALAAFWTTRVTAINRTYFSIMIFLSGRVAPIALLPVWLRETAQALPFYGFIAFPVELALGRLTPDQAMAGLRTQLLWLAIAAGVIASLWRVAVRRFSAVGN
jgi:ABC-2 type transport system permease protein